MDHDEHGDPGDPLGGAGGGTYPGAGPAASTDPLLELRVALDTVDELPLAERARVFDRTHAVVVEELRALELG